MPRHYLGQYLKPVASNVPFINVVLAWRHLHLIVNLKLTVFQSDLHNKHWGAFLILSKLHLELISCLKRITPQPIQQLLVFRPLYSSSVIKLSDGNPELNSGKGHLVDEYSVDLLRFQYLYLHELELILLLHWEVIVAIVALDGGNKFKEVIDRQLENCIVLGGFEDEFAKSGIAMEDWHYFELAVYEKSEDAVRVAFVWALDD